MFAPAAFAGSAADRLLDALAGAHAGLLVAAVALHVAGQVCRGVAWRGVLACAWPDVTRRQACAWHVCGAGLTGVLSTRGGDAVRIALAKRDLDRASWPALAGTLAAEGSFETVAGIVCALLAVKLGVGSFDLPSLWLVGAAAVALPVGGFVAARSRRVRRVAGEVGKGLAVLCRPRRWARQVLPFQVCARLLRFGSASCFLLAFGLPVAPAVVLAATAALGSGAILPVPGAGLAAAAGAMLVAVPMAAGDPVDHAAVAAMAIAWPTLLTLVGVAVSLVLLAALSGARSPRALLRAVQALRPAPAPAAAAPAPAVLAP